MNDIYLNQLNNVACLRHAVWEWETFSTELASLTGCREIEFDNEKYTDTISKVLCYEYSKEYYFQTYQNPDRDLSSVKIKK